MPDRDGLAHVEGLAKVTLRAALVVSPVAVAAAFASGLRVHLVLPAQWTPLRRLERELSIC